MRSIDVLACLVALVPTNGWHSTSHPSAETSFLASRMTPARSALTELLRKGGSLRRTGNPSLALEIFRQGRQQALIQKDRRFEAHFLWGMAQSHMARHRYADALQELLAARDAFEGSDAPAKSLSGVHGTLSTLYSLLGEYDAAAESIRRAMQYGLASGGGDLRARLLVRLGAVEISTGKPEKAEAAFRQGIEEAARFDDLELLSRAIDDLGEALDLQKREQEAEEAYLEAYRIRKLNQLTSLPGSYRRLGLVKLQQGDLRSAAGLLDAAVDLSKEGRGRFPQWWFYDARGRLHLSQGKLREAHHEFGLALELARNYRLMAPASDSTRISLENVLEAVYAGYVETGARLYEATGQAEFVQQTFAALEEERAGSLAAGLDHRKGLHAKLSPEYWEQLDELQSAEGAALLNDSEETRQRMRRRRQSLMEMEARAGGAGLIPPANPLHTVQASLDANTVLFSFHLSQPHSWVWAVGNSSIELYRLPEAGTIEVQSKAFRAAASEPGGPVGKTGRELYQTLFGRIGRAYRDKGRWLLSLDARLFDVPFAALVTGEKGDVPRYLVESHTIRIVSGGTLLSRSPGPVDQRVFIGVGDAVYNRADERWKRRTGPDRTGWLESALSWPWKANAAAPASLGLSRLPGTGTEIAACAREWKGTPVLLLGHDATRENVRRALEMRPAVIHFAAHLLQPPPERSHGALLALSMLESGEEQLVGPSEVARWRADRTLVVLSGCSSGSAEARPGSGLLGMTRAWLMAGARAVVATDWQTPDDAETFFRHFYQSLQKDQNRDPAEALRSAQVQTLQAGGWRASPSYWAAYFAQGNY
ncbi:MAG TPA: CHAT domain-containing tetratricopeptide repeat protein [Bryobacteraceae bacterium]|nr:CHAT domain-containing tetratricopeptide repeat protein [Bryobacteraceae bacterium]